jgi:hypothetical protein
LKLTKWKDAAELVGIAAIVASLIFVGIELQQRMAAAAHYQDRAFKAVDYYFSSMQFETELGRRAQRQSVIDESHLVGDDRAYILSLPLELRSQVHMNGVANLFIWDNLLYQHEAGFLPDATWLTDRARLKRGLQRSSYIRYEIEHNPAGWRREMVGLATGLIAEIEQGE